MSCEKCGHEVKNYGVFLGGVRCRNYCTMSNQGGKREGAGRKPSAKPNKIPICKKLDGDLVAYLKSCPNATAVLESMVRESDGFREWQRKQAFT